MTELWQLRETVISELEQKLQEVQLNSYRTIHIKVPVSKHKDFSESQVNYLCKSILKLYRNTLNKSKITLYKRDTWNDSVQPEYTFTFVYQCK